MASLVPAMLSCYLVNSGGTHGIDPNLQLHWVFCGKHEGKKTLGSPPNSYSRWVIGVMPQERGLSPVLDENSDKVSEEWTGAELSELEVARYANLLRQCGRTRDLVGGKLIHAELKEKEHDQTTFLGNLIVQMYGKCGHVEVARAAFDRICQRNLYSWSIMIAAYVENGNGWEALGVFRWMELEGVKPDEVTFISLLRACSIARALDEGKTIHAWVLEAEVDFTIKLHNSLVSMYAKCGSLEDARCVFDNMERRDVVSWNTVIAAYAEYGHLKEALELYAEMDTEGIEADRITVSSILSACARMGGLAEGKEIHARIDSLGLDLDATGISLINMYGKCGNLSDARSLFDRIEHRKVAVWNAMITAYAQHGYARNALELYWRMDSEGVQRNEITFVTALAACARNGILEDGRAIHSHVIASRLESNMAIATGLINMYGKCGSLYDSKALFDKIQSTNVMFWTSMISVYSQHDHGEEALQLFRRMDLEGIKGDHVTLASVLGAANLAEARVLHERIYLSGYDSSLDVSNSLITLYGKCASLADARRVFDRMHRKNVVSWTAMITAYAQNEHGEAALELFIRMKREGVQPNEVTFVSVLSACSSIGDVEVGKEIHAQVISNALDTSVIVGNALIDMYGTLGCYSEARNVFQKMRVMNVVSWNAMIAAYAQNGHGKEALNIFRRMYRLGETPNAVTFSSILHACNQAGLVDEGHSCFVSMTKNHGITPVMEDCMCMVDLYARAGRLKEAEDLITSTSLAGDATAWKTLLDGCKLHGDVEREVRAAKTILELDKLQDEIKTR